MSDQIVYLAGVEWDDIPGTDRRLASALAAHADVLWVDPPVSAARYARALRTGQRRDIGLRCVAPGITRLRVLVPPGTSRPVMRDLISVRLSRSIRKTVAARQVQHGRPVSAVINASPEAAFPEKVSGHRLLYITDDWVSGASLMGMDPSRVRRQMLRNGRDADVTAAVSSGLAEKFAGTGEEVVVLPNGCNPARNSDLRRKRPRPADLPDGPLAGLVGQINERIDADLVRAVADSGLRVVVIGPRTERSEKTTAALEELFSHPDVFWLGSKEAEQLPEYLASFAVGLTPYADTQFNRSSFPLKTLEYLAAGLPVVSSDLPSVSWLDTAHIRIGQTPERFAAVALDLSKRQDGAATADRIRFARRHSWDARARQVLRHLDMAADTRRRHEEDIR